MGGALPPETSEPEPAGPEAEGPCGATGKPGASLLSDGDAEDVTCREHRASRFLNKLVGSVSAKMW